MPKHNAATKSLFRKRVIRGALENSNLQEHEIDAVMDVVNAHAALVEAMEMVLNNTFIDKAKIKTFIDKAKIKAALALAKGE